MKRVLLHIVFWLGYLLQNAVLIFLVDVSRWPHLTEKERIIIAIVNCCMCLLPKLIFTYFMLYVALEKIVKEHDQLKRYILYSIATFIACLFLYRALVIYFIDPVIYKWPTNVPAYFDLAGFLVALMDIGFASGAAIVIKQIRLQLTAKEMEKN